jgi:hypothetical protein
MSDPIIALTVDWGQYAKALTAIGAPLAISALLWLDNRALRKLAIENREHERLMSKVYLDASLKSLDTFRDLEARYRELSR